MQPISFKGNTEFNVLYFSDAHANTKNIRNFKTAVDKFDKENQDKNTLKLAGGDLNMDSKLGTNLLFLKLMDWIGLDASSSGNHDFGSGDYWAEALEKVKPKFKFLSANLNFSRPNKVENKIAKSIVLEKNGEKVGVIGISPFDYNNLRSKGHFNDYLNVKNFDESVEAVKTEVKLLEKNGINKIFLLAHTGEKSKTGFEYYKNLAKIGGIDVIIGGHDHKEFESWYMSERNEPVKAVSVGRAKDKAIVGENLDSFGTLKAVFNDYGVLVPTGCKNKVEITQNYPATKEIFKELNKEEQLNGRIISHAKRDFTCKNKRTEENPMGSLATDAILWAVNKTTKGQRAKIALVNSGAIRDNITKGDIPIGIIKQAFPFNSTTLIKTTLTKKQIIDTLNWGAKSTTFDKIEPGLMQVGGMRYTIDSNNRVKNVCLINEDGSLGEILDNQPDEKEYTVAYDSFLLTGIAGLTELKKDPNSSTVEHYYYNCQNALIDYLSTNFSDKPIEIKTKRIEIEPKNSAEDIGKKELVLTK